MYLLRFLFSWRKIRNFFRQGYLTRQILTSASTGLLDLSCTKETSIFFALLCHEIAGRASDEFVRVKSILRRALRIVRRRSDTAEAEMIGASVDLAFAARTDDVARAILSVAEK